MQEKSVSLKAKLLWKDLIRQVAKKNCYQISVGKTSAKDYKKSHRCLGEFHLL